MNKKALVFAVAAACLTSGAAFAQSFGYSDDSSVRYEQEDDERDDRRDGYYRQYGTSNSTYARHDGYHRGDRYSRDDRYSRRNHHGYGNNGYYAQQHHQHRRGGYLAREYRNDRYVVSDWRNRGLHQPQYGQQWVQTGERNYLLVAIATGLITQMLMNR